MNISMGAAVSVLLSVVLGAVLALLMINENVSVDTMEYGVFAVLLLATFTGSLVASLMTGQKYALVAIGLAAICVFAQIAGVVLFFNSSFGAVWTNILATLLGCGASCAVCISRGAKNRKRKYRSR